MVSRSCTGNRTTWFSVFLLGTLGGCGAAEPGEISVVFEWTEPPHTHEVMYAWVRVEHREPAQPLTPGILVATAPVVQYERDIQVKLGEIPNGHNYVVVVDMKEAPHPASRSMYHAASDLFSLRPDKETEVPVQLKLKGAPSPPDVHTPGRVTYRRVPWGSDATGGGPTNTVEGRAGAIDPDAWVVVLENAADAARQLGRAQANPDGSFDPIELSRGDLAVVYVATEYAAGWRSDAVAVRHIEWTVTVGGEVLGSPTNGECSCGSQENPNVFALTDPFLPNLTHESVRVVDEVSRLAGVDGNTVLGTAGQRWRERARVTKPTSRMLHAMAYDSARGKVVLFGGYDGGYVLDIWEWEGASRTWTNVTPGILVGPSTRCAHSLAYDSARDKVVLHGGWNGPWLQDTWEWDGASRTWTNVTPPGSKPSARRYAALAYDSARGKVVLFGGEAAEGVVFQDTWEWDSTSRTWTDVTPAGIKPSARAGHALAYDNVRGKVLLFGGWGEVLYQSTFQDTWEWDGATRTWTNVTPAGTRPGGRNRHAMAYDSSRGRVVLHGGWNGHRVLWDTWEWDNATRTWTDVTPSLCVGCVKGPARYAHSLVYDSAHGKVVLFGGDSLGTWTGLHQDTWEWDGTAWVEVTPVGNIPTARFHHAMTYDSAHGKVVLFGGDGSGSWNEMFQDTWDWDGSTGTWTNVTPAGIKPMARAMPSLAYDSGRAKVVLFGGSDGVSHLQDTWEWDGSTGTWTDVTPVGDKPSARTAPMAYDSARGKVVLFGGWDGACRQDTWEWDGTSGTWTDVTPSGPNPSARIHHKLAYDSTREKLVLFGGFSVQGDFCEDTFWEWDGTMGTWTEMAPEGPQPSARINHSLVYDSGRGKVVLFGGYDANPAIEQDIWEWDGTTWTDVTPAGPRPNYRVAQALAYDSAREKLVLFGGGALVPMEDTWECDVRSDGRPAALWDLFWQPATSDNVKLEAVTVKAYAGGVGHLADGSPVHGMNLLSWSTRDGVWRPLASNAADVNSPALVEHTITDPADINDLLFGVEQSMSFALVPSQKDQGTLEYGQIAVDYIEATVHYEVDL
ncbi:kelch repeat-containing protein [Myxococcota bacterium]